MKREFDPIPREYERLTERGYAALIANSGKIIALITGVVAVLVTFTDIAFSSFTGAELTSTLIVTVIASYLMYFSLEDAGERLGEDSAEYRTAETKYTEARAKISPEMLPGLRDYCVRYSNDEVEFRRKAYLCTMGFTIEDYESYLEGKEFPVEAKRAFAHVKGMRHAALTPALLLNRESGGGECELEMPEKYKMRTALSRLIPSTLCMLFTASVILTAKPDLTPTVIIEGILKLSALPVIGFRGYIAGYKYSRGAKCAWLETKVRILNGFLAERGKTAQNPEA